MKKLTKKSLDELALIMPVISEKNQQTFLGGTGSLLGSLWNATADGTNATYTNTGSGSFTDGSGMYNYGSGENLGDNFYYDSGYTSGEYGSGFNNGLNNTSTNYVALNKYKTSDYITNFSDSYSAHTSAMLYSDANQVECCGYVFKDGTAIVFHSPTATIGGTSYPKPLTIYTDGKTFYEGKEIVETFHTHFNGPQFSNPDNAVDPLKNDQTSQTKLFPNATLTIIYQGGIYNYPFNNGSALLPTVP